MYIYKYIYIYLHIHKEINIYIYIIWINIHHKTWPGMNQPWPSIMNMTLHKELHILIHYMGNRFSEPHLHVGPKRSENKKQPHCVERAPDPVGNNAQEGFLLLTLLIGPLIPNIFANRERPPTLSNGKSCSVTTN